MLCFFFIYISLGTGVKSFSTMIYYNNTLYFLSGTLKSLFNIFITFRDKIKKIYNNKENLRTCSLFQINSFSLNTESINTM